MRVAPFSILRARSILGEVKPGAPGSIASHPFDPAQGRLLQEGKDGPPTRGHAPPSRPMILPGRRQYGRYESFMILYSRNHPNCAVSLQ